jgi:hypothetical protein
VSAECNIHGCDLVYPPGSWPLGECQVCTVEAALEACRAEKERLREGLEAIRDCAYLNQGGRVSSDWLYVRAGAALAATPTSPAAGEPQSSQEEGA